MKKLIEAAEQTIKDRLEWLEQAEKAKALLQRIPELGEFEADYCTIDCNYDSTLKITVSFMGDESDEQSRLAQKFFETCNVVFEEPKHSYGEQFRATGSSENQETKIDVDITGYGMPLGCELVYKRRMRKVAEVICQKTGKALK